MKKIILLFWGTILFLNLMAQTPTDYKWAVKAGGTGTEEGKAIATDKAGNVYVTGYFKNTATFGSLTSVVSLGGHDAFVAKYDSSGNALWVNTLGGTDADEGYGIAADTLGNIYVAGTFGGTVTVGAGTLTSTGSFDVFVLKYNTSGTLLWARSAGGASADNAYGIATNKTGEIFITGKFNTSTTFGSTTLTSTGQDDIFIAKYDNSGNVLWAKKAGSTSGDLAKSISIDDSGNLYITGNFSGTATFLGSTNVSLTSSGQWDAYIAKYDPAGNVLWAKKGGGSNHDHGLSVAVDLSGNSYITCYTQSTSVNFGGKTFTSSGQWDIFVAKYNTSGSISWLKKLGGNQYDYAYGIAADKAGQIILTGGFANTVAFGSVSLTSTNTDIEDMFAAKMDSTGTVLWAMKAGAAGNQYVWGNAVTTDNIGDIYLTGSYEGTAAFGSTSLASSGGDESYGEDIFIAKINQNNITTGLTAYGYFSDISIYPTITTGIINIAGENIKSVKIINSLGQTIINNSKNDCKNCRTAIDLSVYKNGIYFIKIETENNRIVIKKVIISH